MFIHSPLSRLKNAGRPACLQNLSNAFPWFLLFCTYFLAILFQVKYGDDLLNSDMSAEMLLAKELNDSGSLLFAKNWFYSTEIRVLYQHIPLRLGLLLFPHNWSWARLLGQAIMLALHAASFIYLMSSLGCRKAGIYGAAALMCPFGFWYTFYGVYSGMYLAHMILFSLTLGLILNIVQCSSRWKSAVLVLLVTILGLLQGMGGVRMLMNLYAPLCLTVFIVLILQLNVKPFDKPFYKDPLIKLGFLTIYATVACLLGYLINSSYLSQAYTFKSFEGEVWQSFQLSRLSDNWSEYLSLFGYPYVEFAEWISATTWANVLLISKRGILSATSIVLMASILISIFRSFKLWGKLSTFHKIIALLLPICLLVSGISFSFLSDLTSDFKANGSYWLPLVPLTFSYVILWIKNEEFRLSRLYKGIIGAVLFLCILCTSLSSSYQFIHNPPRTALKMETVGQWLVDNGYNQGYATFWYSDVLTEHTNGKIEMWTLTDPSSHTIYQWLQTRDHLDHSPDGKCFVLLAQREYDENKDSLPYHIYDDTIVYNENGYVILAYDSIDQALK